MNVSYDGTRYQGWQKNKNAENTLQDKLETLISRYLGEPVEVHGSGRTDKGVHAIGQVISFKSSKKLDKKTTLIDLQGFCPEDIAFYELEEVDERFHARLSAVSKTYAYHIWKADAKEQPIFCRKYVTIAEAHLNGDGMKLAAQKLIGRHDFKGYSSDKTKKSTTRDLMAIDFEETDNEWIIRFTANGFLYNMVRILVGTLLEVGYGLRHVNTVTLPYDSLSRADAGMTAPAQGLFLEKVAYPQSIGYNEVEDQ